MSDEHDYNIGSAPEGPPEGPPQAHPRQIEAIARVCHEANRAVRAYIGEEAGPVWEEAPEWVQKSVISGVKNVLQGAGTQANHENWMEERTKAGWTYGPVKDDEAKTHPCLVPYHELPPEQQAKDKIFGAIVRALNPEPPTPIITGAYLILDEDGQALATMNPEDHLRFNPRRQPTLADIDNMVTQVSRDTGRIIQTQIAAEPIAQRAVQLQAQVAKQMQEIARAEKIKQQLDLRGGHPGPGGRPRR